jgi:glutamate formiminotransferase
VLECVLNVSEGRDQAALRELTGAAGADLLDVHTDPDHHRSVLTLAGTDAVRAVASAAVERIDLRQHHGAHPRLGVVDVVPFVPLGGSTMADALAARTAFATWLASEHGVPCFLYGPERSLPDIRRHAFSEIAPDHGPDHPHPTAGATCVGARPVLVAYNLWIAGLDVAGARDVAAAVRRPGLRSLGLQVGGHVQVSMNLVDPLEVGPAEAYALVQRQLAATGGGITRAELVGLVPRAVLDRVSPSDWARLDLAEEATIEARLAARPA